MLYEYWNKIRKSTVFKLTVTAGISYVMYLLAPFLLTIVLSIALAFALYPLANIFTKIPMARGMLHFSRVVAIVLSILCFCALVFMFITILVLPLLGQMNELLQQLPALSEMAKNPAEVGSKLPGGISELPSDYDSLVSTVLSWAMSALGSMMKNLFDSSLSVVQSIIGLVIVPFLTFYFLKDWKELRLMVIEFFNKDDQDKVAEILNEMGRTLSAYANGMAKLSLLSGCVIAMSTAVLGVDYPLVLGFVAMLTEFVPVVGPLLGAIPAVFLAYQSTPQLAMWVAVLYAVYYQIDANVILPRIMGAKINLRPVVIIISVFIGAKLFGILGMIFAIPTAAVYRVLYDKLWHAYDD